MNSNDQQQADELGARIRTFPVNSGQPWAPVRKVMCELTDRDSGGVIATGEHADEHGAIAAALTSLRAARASA